MKDMTDRGSTQPEMMKLSGEDDMQQMMSPEHRMEMLRMHHQKTLWGYWTIIMLGIWMMVGPATCDFGTATVTPPGGRTLWLELSNRVRLLAWSDFLSGLLLVILGWRSLTPDHPLSLWGTCFVGIWINAVPLLFWAPNPLTYLNDTFVGTLVIALAILISVPGPAVVQALGADLDKGVFGILENKPGIFARWVEKL